MRIAAKNTRLIFKAGSFLAGIGLGLTLESPAQVQSEAALANGLFVGTDDKQVFEAHFDDQGGISVTGDFGAFSGRWWMMGARLCVTFADGPKQGQHCEVLSRHGPSEFQIGDQVVLLRIASAKRFL